MAMLRVASSKVIPCAVGAIYLERALLGSIASAFNSRDHQGYKVAEHFFSTSCGEGDFRLMKLLKSEIKLQKCFLDIGMPSAPSHFPFTVKDDNDKLILTRNFNEEKIQVVVDTIYNMPEELETDSDISSGDEEKEKLLLDLTVTVSKENGKTTEFMVSASSDKIMIHYYLIQEPVPESDEMLTFVHTHVCEESDLQVALGEFLKIRGINKDYYEFLCKHLVRVRKSGPLVAMKKLRNFITEE